MDSSSFVLLPVTIFSCRKVRTTQGRNFDRVFFDHGPASNISVPVLNKILRIEEYTAVIK